MTKRILVTSALPYANGSLHLGHIVEHVQTDIFVRFNKLIGNDVNYACAADCHGTPIELKARKLGEDPAVMTQDFRLEHMRDFQAFGISHDIYDSTHAPLNGLHAEIFYKMLRDAGHIVEKPVEQFYCEKDGRFLPDRYLRGGCPYCYTPDQYGEVCSSCNRSYEPAQLKDPRCVLCNTAPIRRTSNHFFVRLSVFTDVLLNFIQRLQPEIQGYVKDWIEKGLHDWDISRDGPYFGFEIPDAPGKFFYVWLDAPLGYLTAFAHLAGQKKNDKLAWPKDTDTETEIVQFIGKDIVYFHTLFWPALLKTAGYKLPTSIQVHGMLNFDGKKMAKSGEMITARRYLETLDPSYIRYFIGANLGTGLDDIDFSLSEFLNRANAGLVKNIGNLAQRSLSFAKTRFDGKLGISGYAYNSADWQRDIRGAYERRDFRTAIKQIEALASAVNAVFQEAAPWQSIKTDPAKALSDTSWAINNLKTLATMLLPVVPKFATSLFAQLNVPVPTSWDEGVKLDLPEGHLIGEPSPLLPPLGELALKALFSTGSS